MDGEELLDWRERHGMSQGRLAKFFGYVRQTIANWESGDNPIPAWVPYALRGIDALEEIEARERSMRSPITVTIDGTTYRAYPTVP